MTEPGVGGRPITYLSIGSRFLYLVAIIDWARHAVLAWRLPDTMDVSLRLAAPASAGIKISMDGCGRWMDNGFIWRLWRSLKHEDIDLKGYADSCEAKVGIANWIAFYNGRRLHQAHPAIARRWGGLARTNASCERDGQR